MQKYHRAARAFKALLSHHINSGMVQQISYCLQTVTNNSSMYQNDGLEVQDNLITKINGSTKGETKTQQGQPTQWFTNSIKSQRLLF